MGHLNKIFVIMVSLLSIYSVGCHNSSEIYRLKLDLNSDDENKRWGALIEICKIGPDAKRLFPEVLKALDDENWRLRQSGVLALEAIGPIDKVIPEIIRMLDDNNEWVRMSAADTLGHFGNKAVSAFPKLQELALSDSSERVKSAAKKAIEHIKGD
jgi:HEAT repeat protein